MMGPRQVDEASLFYEFSLERHVPATHLLRSIDRFVNSDVRSRLAPFYSSTGRPSIDPELLVRMLPVGYCYGMPSARRLCEKVHLNLAYRWFCRLSLDGAVPDHSTFSKNRHGRFRDCDLPRGLGDLSVSRPRLRGYEQRRVKLSWVDQHNTSGLGENIPMSTANLGDGFVALKDGKMITIRIPYPLSFCAKGLDGRIDDPNGGWKGRGLWSTNGDRTPWLKEGGKGSMPRAVNIQFRPDPLVN